MLRYGCIESIILKDGQKRGMDILAGYLGKQYIYKTAKKLNSLKRGVVFLTTGFYVNGAAETDGPIGTYFLSNVLFKMGFTPIILTDKYCEGFFDINIVSSIKTIYLSLDNKACENEIDRLVLDYDPVALIAIERCGKNIDEDYCNMSKISIMEHTANIDYLFEKYDYLPRIGIGDGGNEIGMGVLKEVIIEEIPIIKASTITIDELIVSAVSNWGAYALIAYLSIINKNNYMVPFDLIKEYLYYINSLGSVDGVLGGVSNSVDGFSEDYIQQIYEELLLVVNQNLTGDTIGVNNEYHENSKSQLSIGKRLIEYIRYDKAAMININSYDIFKSVLAT